MKKLIGAAFLILLIYSCKKDAVKVPLENDQYLRTVLGQLKDSLSPADYLSLDTNSTYLTNPEETNNYILRIAFKGKPIISDFLLVHSNANGAIRIGTTVHLENSTPANSYQFSGSISLRSLSGKNITQSEIVAGYILSLHTGNKLKTIPSGTKAVTTLPAPDADWSPDVIIIGSSGGEDAAPYISLNALVGSASNGGIDLNSGASLGDSNPGGGGTSGSNGNAGNSGTTPSNIPPTTPYSPLDPTRVPPHRALGTSVIDPLGVEAEYIYNIPVVDVRKYFNCFDQIPSAGASYTVQLCVDVPINSNPAASMNFSATNSGHSFLVVTKTNGGQSITQVFGYYPATKLSLLDPFSPVPSTIKNNGTQEINGSLTMNITADQFANLKSSAIAISTRPYALNSSNCTDYALGVFNAARSSPLVLDPYVLTEPGIVISGANKSAGFTVTIPNSPQQLFAKLNTMKIRQSPESPNIQIDLSHKLKSPASHGECD